MDLRCALFEATQRLSFAYHNETNTGQLISRVSRDVDRARRFFSGAVFSVVEVTVYFAGALTLMFAIDVKLTLLSPTKTKLSDLKPKWENEVRDNNLDPGFGLEPNDEGADDGIERFSGGDLPDVKALAEATFEEDGSEANGSSIAFLFEYDGWRLLFAGDAHPGLLVKSLERLGAGKPLGFGVVSCELDQAGTRLWDGNAIVEGWRGLARPVPAAPGAGMRWTRSPRPGPARAGRPRARSV